jgi:hypothetical protein
MNCENVLAARRKAEATYDRRIDPRPPKEQPTPPKLRISIIGPLGGQAREIEARTATITRPLDLRFFEKDHVGENVPTLVDYCIVTKHCNHVWWEKAKAALPADRVKFVDGGIEKVVQTIYDLASRQPVPGNGQSVAPDFNGTHQTTPAMA